MSKVTDWLRNLFHGKPKRQTIHVMAIIRQRASMIAGTGSISVTVADTVAPSTPTGLTAVTVSTTQINLSWNAATDQPSLVVSGVASYRIYQAGILVTTVASPTLTKQLTGLSPGSSFQFQITAVDAYGNESAKSAIVLASTPSVDTTAPVWPGGTIFSFVEVTSYSVRLSWVAATDNIAVDHYTLERALDAGFTVGLVTLYSGTSRIYNDQTVEPSTTYYFRVYAYDAAGNRSLAATTSQTTTGATTPDWQLAAGHYIPAVMQAQIIHPRPDNDGTYTTSSWERHRMAPDGIEWRIPIVVQGGSWPFKYSVDATSAAKGISIGEVYGDADYGVLSWASPTIGSHDITVTVQTQEKDRNTSGFSEPDQISFTLVVADKTDVTKFLFVDPLAADDSGTGSYSSPKKTLAGIVALGTTLGRQVFFREGADHVMPSTYNLGSTLARVLVGFPGESPVLEMSTGYFNTGSGSYGIYVEGLRFNNYQTTASNWRCFSLAAGATAQNRTTFFENYWYNQGVGTSGTSNTSCCFFYDPNAGVYHRFISFVNNTYDTLGAGSNGTSCMDTYATIGLVAEGNTLKNSTMRYGFFLKSSTGDATVRNNLAWENNTSGVGIIEVDTYFSSNPTPNGIEVCYNRTWNKTPRVNSTDKYQGVSVDQIRSASVLAGAKYWTYRNSSLGGIALYAEQPLDASSICAGNAAGPTTGSTQPAYVGWDSLDTSTNITLSVSDFDSSGNFTAAYKTANPSYVGTRGAEIA